MNISAPFINRPAMTTLVMIALFVAGLLAFYKLPVTDLPPISYPEIAVVTHYTSANPETLYTHVTQPLEKELIQVHGVQEISSSSGSGISNISLKFSLSTNMHEAAR